MEKSIDNTEGKRQKKRFFSLDARYEIFGPLREVFGRIKDLAIQTVKTPRVPLTTFDQALATWGLSGSSDDELAVIARNMKLQSLMMFVLLAGVLGMGLAAWRNGATTITLVQYIMMVVLVPVPAIILLWKQEILSTRQFISFLDYVSKGRFLVSSLFFCAYMGSFSVAEAATVIDLPHTALQLQTDISSRMIGQIFGEPWAAMGGNVLSAGIDTLILPILGVLNVGALTFVSVFCVYIYAMGAVQGAHLGNWSDNQIFSTFWSPLRTTFALAFVAPMGNGISVMQHIILVAIAMSINLANNVTTVFMDHVSAVNGISMTSSLGARAEENFGQSFMAVSQGITLQFAAREIFGLNIQGDRVFTETEVTNNGKTIITISMNPPELISKADMPSIQIESQSLEVARGIAEGVKQSGYVLVEAIMKYFPATGRVADRADLSVMHGIVAKMHETYSKNVLHGYNSAVLTMNGQDAKAKQMLKNMTDQTKVYGWASAGIYPFTIAMAQSQIQNYVKSNVSAKGLNWDAALKRLGVVHKVEISMVESLFTYFDSQILTMQATGTYAGLLTTGTKLPSNSGDSFFGQLLNEIEKYVQRDIPTKIVTSLKETNPLAVMFGFGDYLVTISAISLTILAGIAGAIEASTLSANIVAGVAQVASVLAAPFTGGASMTVGAGATVLAGAGLGMLKIWGPVLTAVLALIMGFGLACCYLLPIIPVVFWARALVTWIVLVLETMVAAPFWAAAHVFPEGVGLAGQHARQGYLLLFDVFIRPVLLVCGAIISIILLQALGQFLAEILGIWAIATNQAASYWLIGVLVTSATMLFIMYTTIKWLFLNAIGIFPEQVMRWLGSRGSDTGTQDAGHQVSSMAGQLGSGKGALGGVASGALGGAAGAKGKIASALKEKMGEGKEEPRAPGINH